MQANLRRLVRRVLGRYGYLPDLQPTAVALSWNRRASWRRRRPLHRPMPAARRIPDPIAYSLYQHGDIPRETYLCRRDELQAEIHELVTPETRSVALAAGKWTPEDRPVPRSASKRTTPEPVRLCSVSVWRLGDRTESVRRPAAYASLRSSNCSHSDWMGLATPSGFEPPISTLTGWHVRPLHHGARNQRLAFPALSGKAIQGTYRSAMRMTRLV